MDLTQRRNRCYYDSRCTNVNCTFFHPSRVQCKYGNSCTRQGCWFSHAPTVNSKPFWREKKSKKCFKGMKAGFIKDVKFKKKYIKFKCHKKDIIIQTQGSGKFTCCDYYDFAIDNFGKKITKIKIVGNDIIIKTTNKVFTIQFNSPEPVEFDVSVIEKKVREIKSYKVNEFKVDYDEKDHAKVIIMHCNSRTFTIAANSESYCSDSWFEDIGCFEGEKIIRIKNYNSDVEVVTESGSYIIKFCGWVNNEYYSINWDVDIVDYRKKIDEGEVKGIYPSKKHTSNFWITFENREIEIEVTSNGDSYYDTDYCDGWFKINSNVCDDIIGRVITKIKKDDDKNLIIKTKCGMRYVIKFYSWTINKDRYIMDWSIKDDDEDDN